MYIAIFGPPCSGKTSIVNYAKIKGFYSIDAEDFGSTYQTRVKGFQEFLKSNVKSEFIFVGAADLTPQDFPENTIFILNIPPFDEYENRILQRDKAQPSKIGHNGKVKYNEFVDMKPNFDYCIEETWTIEESFEKVLKWLNIN
jgi:hypothetical protein